MNAKQELLSIVRDKKIIAARIDYSPNWYETTTLILRKGYSEEHLNMFLASLDFQYDDGYGMQYLFGTVWLEDGAWLTRGEYDGSEWWNLHKLPEIPENLIDGEKMEKILTGVEHDEENYDEPEFDGAGFTEDDRESPE